MSEADTDAATITPRHRPILRARKALTQLPHARPPSVREEFRRLVRKDDGTANPIGLSVLFAFACKDIASIAAFVAIKTDGISQKAALAIGGLSLVYGAAAVCLAGKNLKEFWQKAKQQALPYSGAYLAGGCAGAFAAVAYKFGENMAGHVAKEQIGPAIADGIFVTASLAAAAPLYYLGTRKTKLWASASAAKRFFHTSLAIAGISYLSGKINTPEIPAAEETAPAAHVISEEPLEATPSP